jgi:pSer/pThr/pTyr-binding forkhead associated (FHA) protein
MEAMTGELMVCSGPAVGQTYPMDGRPMSVGRAASCDVPLDDDRASSVHARVLYERGQHRLVDLDSTNGTFVNNQRVQDILLRPGDLIQIGETIFEYRRNETPEVVEPVPVTAYVPQNSQPVPHDRALAIPRAEDYYYPPQPGPYGHLPPGAMPGGATTTPTEEKLDIASLWGWAKPLIGAFLPYWWAFMLAALLGAVTGMMQYRLNPPPKRAYFEINLVPRANEAVSDQYGGGKLEFFREAEQNFVSGRLIRQTYEELGAGDITPATIAITQRVFLALHKTGGFNSNLYMGSFIHRDPDFALSFLQTHLDNYLDTEIEKALRIVLAEQAFFRRELATAKERQEAAEEALVAYKASNVDSAGGASAYANLHDLRTRLQRLESRIADEELQLSYERAKLKRVSKFTVLEKTENNPYQSQIAQLEAKLAEERAAGKGPRHPDVIKVQQNLNEVRALAEGATGNTRSAVRSSKNPIYAAAEARVYELESSLGVARQEKARLQSKLKTAQTEAALMPEEESRLEDLQAEFDAAKGEVDRIEAKLRQSEQQVELERASAEARHDLITPPQLEYVDHRAEMRKRATKATIAAGGLSFLLVGAWLVYRRKITLEMLKLPKKTVPVT